MKAIYTLRRVLFIGLNLICLCLYSQPFVEQTTLPGVSRGTVAWGDYDNDGDQDILIFGDSGPVCILKIYRNSGSPTYTFLEQAITFSIAIPTTITDCNFNAQWADFDNDGLIDIIITGSNYLKVYRNMGGNTFQHKINIDFMSTSWNSLDCGDYDNDGDIDFILITSAATRIFQNQGGFIFNEQYSISIPGFYDSSTKWGDFDNDGDLDIVCAGRGSTLIYQNQGDNVFTPQADIALYGGVRGSSAWGDYNSDGLLDILFTGNGNSIIYKNNGNNSFVYQHIITLPNVVESTGKWGDLENDGDLDIIISGKTGSSYTTKVYLNNGDNTFTEQTSISIAGVYQSSVDLCDYDNDSDLDILIAGSNGTSNVCKVYRNDNPLTNPTPAAPAGLTSTLSGSSVTLRWRPVTTDNTANKSISYNVAVGTTSGSSNVVNPLISASGSRVVSGYGNAQLDTTFILKNLKKGTYYWKVQAVDNSFKGGLFSAEASFIYTVSNQAYGLSVPVNESRGATLSWARGNGSSCIVFMKEGSTGQALPVNSTTYSASTVFKSGAQIGATGWYCVYKGNLGSVAVTGLKPSTDYIFQVIEFDGATGSESYFTQTLPGNPLTYKASIFTRVANLLPVTYPSSNSQYSSSSWVDFDNDNDLDLLLVGIDGYRLYCNDGSGVFTLLSVSLSNGSATCADYNSDGLVDIMVSSSSPVLYKNTSSGGSITFTAQPGVAFKEANYGSNAWGDYDNDGDLDLVQMGHTTTGQLLTRIYRNDGGSTLTEQNLIELADAGYGALRWGDYNNDSFLDLLVTGYSNSSAEISLIYRNDGNGSFTKQTGIVLDAVSHSSAAWGDYDSDGDLDFLLSGESSSGIISKVYRNNGDNTFTEQTGISLTRVHYSSAAWGDYDNDGDLDIVLAGYNNSDSPFTKIFRNNGNSTFTEDTSCPLLGVGYCSASWGDYDRDGDLDIALTGNSINGPVSLIYRNDIVTHNTSPAAPTGISATVNKSDVTLKWKSVRTDNTNYRSITYNVMVGTSTKDSINTVTPHSAASGFRRVATMGNCNLDTTFTLKKLPLGTYYWSVQAIDNGFAGGPFSGEGSFSIVPVQAKNLSARIASSHSLTLRWERGNGDRCAVFCKQAAVGLASPVNNITYTADGEFGYGSQVGSTGWYCVYSGRADSVTVTGLIYQREYRFHVIEYTGISGSEQYFPQVGDGNPGVFTTSLFAEQTGIITTPPNGSKSNVCWGDYDNDGFVDLLHPGYPKTILYHNSGDNTFTDSGTTLAGIGKGSAAWGDYDNDGDLDILLAGWSGAGCTTKIYENNGGISFYERTDLALAGVYNGSVAWGDYDSDGHLDILLTGAMGAAPNYSPATKIYRSNGDGTFTEQAQIALPGVFLGSAVWGDYDNDGDLDILLMGATDNLAASKIASVFENNGDNSFTERKIAPAPNINYSTLYSIKSSSSWGDFDNDGDLDFLVTSAGAMYVYKNTGDSQFLLFKFVNFSFGNTCSAAWGDYDNNGYLDIILTNPGLDTKLFRNTSGAGFTQQDDDALQTIGYDFVGWCDYDNDGDLDFALDMNGQPIKIFRNNRTMRSGQFRANAAPAASASLVAVNTPQGVTLKWNSVRSDETPYKAMTYNVRVSTVSNGENTLPAHSNLLNGYRRIAAMGNAQLDTTFTLKNLISGDYFLSVQAVDQAYAGGAWTPEKTFTVKNTQAFFSFDEVCQGLPTQFTDQSVPTGGIATWKWDFNDGNTSTLQNPTHTYAASGSYSVKLVITNATGDKDSLVQVVSVKPKPTTSFTAPPVCQGSTMTFTNTTNGNNLTIDSWYWDFGDGQTSTIQQPTPHGYLGLGQYPVVLKAHATNGCIDSTRQMAIVSSYPVAIITANAPLTFCQGDSVILSVGYNSNYTYQWKIDGTGITNGNSNNYNAKFTGNLNVEVVNTTGSCKTTSDPVTVKVMGKPSKPSIAEANNITLFCPDTEVELKVINTSLDQSYQWKRLGTAIDGAINTTYKGPLAAGSYTVEAKIGSCVAESDAIVLSTKPAPAKPQIYVMGPNVWVLVCENTTASDYRWFYDNQLIPEAKSNVYVANQNLGKYYVEVNEGEECYTMSDVITIPIATTGIEEVNPFAGLNIYPNPTSGLFTIDMNNKVFGELTISIVTREGKEAFNFKFKKTTQTFSTQIDLSGQAKGLYILNLQIEKNKVSRKLIVE